MRVLEYSCRDGNRKNSIVEITVFHLTIPSPRHLPTLLLAFSSRSWSLFLFLFFFLFSSLFAWPLPVRGASLIIRRSVAATAYSIDSSHNVEPFSRILRWRERTVRSRNVRRGNGRKGKRGRQGTQTEQRQMQTGRNSNFCAEWPPVQ